MLARIIEWCAGHRFLVFAFTLLLVLAGIYSLHRVTLDALPDISDVEVIIHTPWAGEPPTVIEDQVTYPIVTTLLSAPNVKAVRAQTMFGDSFVFVVFQDGTDLYWARSRVLEYLQQIEGRLPADVHPVIGPDATGAGWVYEYAVVDRSHTHSLADLRSLQDWFLRYQLATVPGVAEIGTIGGMVRQYQVNLDPDKLRAYGIPLATVIARVRESTSEVGGRLLEMSGTEYMVRGLGYLTSLHDLDEVPLATTKAGVPVLVKDVGDVSFGPDIRRGVADWNGEGEAVGGIVVMRDGMNALNVITGVKRKLAEIAPSLPAGVQILAGYDRSGLIRDSIGTLRRDLLAEAAIVSVVILLFLFHIRSALIPILTLPIAVVASFIPMYYLGISSNIMSLGGLALAIGVLVDAGIVMVENGYRHLSERQARGFVSEPERRRILIDAATQVGPALFVSLVIIVVSFLPVFMLEAQEGRMFTPLAWTKTLAVSFSSILSITLVPLLMVIFIRGRLRPESKNPVSRITQALYLPVLRLCLRHRILTVVASLMVLIATVPLVGRIGSQFMPPLFEGSSLFMPTALPGISITQASGLLQAQDRVIRSFPEVESVFGSIGRSDSATDNAPLSMYDTTVMLKPRDQWPAGVTYERLVADMDAKLQIPGLTNTWTMPVQNRLDMELTGIKTPLGLKIQGPSLEGIQQIGARVQQILSSGLPNVRSIFAERLAEGSYVDVQVHRLEAARYGLTVADVQRAVTSGIGGENVAENVEGRERYPINVRYSRDFRGDIDALRRVVVATPTGAAIPIGEVADVSFSKGPDMIRDEDALLTGYVYVDLTTKDYGGFVQQADALLRSQLHLPAGYTYRWSGEYEFEQRAKARLTIIMPIVFVLMFVLLYMTFDSAAEVAALIVPTAFAMTGGLLLQLWLGYNFSVAVWVGYIALFGIAVETGVVMIVYLHEALHERAARGAPLTRDDVREATLDGAVLRLRPKLMTVFAVLASLVPILYESGIGSDVMKPIAAPIVGGMVTSTIAVLILVPVFFAMLKERALRRGRLALHVTSGTADALHGD